MKLKTKTTKAPEKETRTRSKDLQFINARNVKLLALGVSYKDRNGRFKRVSKGFLRRCNSHLANFVRSEVQRHPSKGKTIL
jgi:hypothetical protein